MGKKIKTATISIPGHGEFKIKFTPSPVSDSDCTKLTCDSCKFCELCTQMIDPRHPEDSKASFNDFCLACGDPNKTSADILNDETIEDLIPDPADVLKFAKEMHFDVYQQVMEKNPYVLLGDVVDQVCGTEGYSCPMYNKDHSNCTYENDMCVLKKLFDHSNRVQKQAEENKEENKEEQEVVEKANA